MLVATNSQGAAPAKPNIVFILSDDHSIQTIGAYNSRLSEFCRQHAVTPNIDRLAAEGGLFVNSFCGNSICSPSRATILTGLHSHANGVRNLSQSITEGLWTYPRSLNDAGYQTAVIGKWHLARTVPEFQHWQIFPDQGTYHDSVFKNATGRETIAGYVTDVVTEMSVDWIAKRDRAKPFFIAVQHKAPHRNFIPPPRHATWLDGVEIPEPDTLFDDYSGRASPARNQKMTVDQELMLEHDLKVGGKDAVDPRYAARNADYAKRQPVGRNLVRWKYQLYLKDYLRCVKAVDDGVGRLLEALKTEGIDQQTIVIYSSDQGFFMGEHGWMDKRWIYEESLHMPLIIRWPGVIPPGTRYSEFVQNKDYAPTFVELAGGRIPAGLHGRSFVPILRGQTPEDWQRSVYYHYYDSGHGVAKHYGLRSQRFTLARFYTTDEWELFDNDRDPQQMRSVAGDPDYAKDLAQQRDELQKLRAEYGDTDGS